ncbi:RluA family pseudouridine synthase [Candidatus Gottesmanbacteria bacterium]|nr:RluA family pseudouridine synthase [Candidatus Gottesmanbacteria bacterium]
MNIPILFEDDFFIVINKPPGVVVNRAESVKGETIQDWAEECLSSRPPSRDPSFENTGFRVKPGMTAGGSDYDFYSRSGIVHRIDKETSGILLIAKTPAAFVELQRQFKERIVKKTYLALVHGQLVPAEGEIRAPVGRLPWNRERFGIVPGGKEAVTRYKNVKVSERQGVREKEVFSLVELYPETGRTHQIRVHLKYINHPIIGDPLYAGRKTARDDRRWAPRVMLHAWKIAFLHPTSGQPVDFVAPIPDDMKSVSE